MEKPRLPSGGRLRNGMVTGMKQLDLAPCTLGEGALWNRETQEFVFTDIVNGRLYTCTPEGTVRQLLQCRFQLGAFLFDRQGDLLLFTECGVYACPYGGTESDFRPVWQLPLLPGERFNDAVCDPLGRVLAGTKTETDTNGSLWLLQAGQAPRRLLSGLKISNGMGFAEGGRILYHTDSGDRAIRRFRYDLTDGSLTADGVVVQLDSPDGAVPDGMTLDADGNLWTACWGGGCVRCYTPDGRWNGQFNFPAQQVSSVALGGTNGRQMLVTSAAVGTDGGAEGGIWLQDVPVAGAEDFRAVL